MATSASKARKAAREREELEQTLEDYKKEIVALKGRLTKLEKRVNELEGGK